MWTFSCCIAHKYTRHELMCGHLVVVLLTEHMCGHLVVVLLTELMCGHLDVVLLTSTHAMSLCVDI